MAGLNDETRREGAKATRLHYSDALAHSKGQSYAKGAHESQSGTPVDPNAGYVAGVGELERNDDTRHPTAKTWVRRDRKPNAYLHTGGG